ncbi:MAG: biopolymer transporter ExbD [Burkholderiales bacterium]|nr:biopolymer transporter ExbD [Burkholderiales bacterium]
MDFRRGKHREEPEINLVPLIDVLLVILIFLMVTTTYSKFGELKITLPEASTEKPPQHPNPIIVTIDAQGHYMVNSSAVPSNTVDALSLALRRAAADQKDPVIVINADAKSTHQSVVNVMEAARVSGYTHITFTTQSQ